MTKNFKITRVNETCYKVWRKVSPSNDTFFQFVFSWVFTISTLGMGLIIYLVLRDFVLDGVGLPDLRYWLKLPSTTWDCVGIFKSLEESIEHVENLKEFEKEVYYM